MSILSHSKFRQVGQDIVDAFEALQIDDRHRQVALRRAVEWITAALASAPEPTVIAASPPLKADMRLPMEIAAEQFAGKFTLEYSLEKLRKETTEARLSREAAISLHAPPLPSHRRLLDVLDARLRRLEDLVEHMKVKPFDRPSPLGAAANRVLADGNIYRCESQCGAEFVHPNEPDGCDSVDGSCAHLMNAGWRPVYVRIFPDKCGMKWNEKTLLLARGGWLCGDCVKKYERKR